MKRPSTTPLALSSTGEVPSLLPKALRDLSGATSLKHERVGHCLATWPLSCPLARRQFNNAVQNINAATSAHTTGEACQATAEVYATSLLPRTAMCQLVLNLHAPKSLWRTLSELYMLRKSEYHRTMPGGPYTRPLCTEQDFPVATVLPKATGISWPFASRVKYILSRPGLVRSTTRTFRLTFIVQGHAHPVAGGNWTQLTISLANFDRFARSPAGLSVLSMANCDDKAMETLGTLWKSNWKVFLSSGAHRSLWF